MTIWTYYWIAPEEKMYLDGVDTGLDLMPRRAWRTEAAAKAAAEAEFFDDFRQAAENEAGYEAGFVEGGEEPAPAEPPEPAWARRDSGESELDMSERGLGSWVVYKMDVEG